MNTKKPLVWTLAVGASLALASFSLATDDRTAEEIITDINAVKMPAYDRARNEAEKGYRAEFNKLRSDASQSKAALIGELNDAYPNNSQLLNFLPERWGTLSNTDALGVIEEVQSILGNKDRSDDLKLLAAFWNAQASQTAYGRGANVDYGKVAAAINGFIESYPADSRNVRLLTSLAGSYTPDPKDAAKIWKRMIADYPDNRSAKYWTGKLRQVEELGKPFELSFTNAINDSEISMDQLKGQVVVLDFWATWCGPCIAEMPEMKRIYAEYKDQGVEFLGISLDQPEEKGGLESLKKYCADNDIQWPQYYQGNYWQSEYSVSWGINSIPAMFVIDQKGNLYSVNARGKLDEMLPELLGIKGGTGG